MAFKKILLSLAVPAILSITGCYAPSRDISPVRLERWREMQKFQPKSIYEIPFILKNNIEHKDEKNDFWSSARKTFMDAKEDCDGIAIAGAYLSEKLGYPPKLLLVNTGEFHPIYQHALTLLEEKRNGHVYYGAIDDKLVIQPVWYCLDKLLYSINQTRDFNEPPYLCYKVYDLDKKSPKWRTTNSDTKNFSEKFFGLLSFRKINLEKIKGY